MSKIYRFEFKYEMDPRTAYFIEQELRRFGMKSDDTREGGEYYVTSLYYDSRDLSDYQDKTGGFLRRKKFRVRIYEPFLDKSQTIWLEIKNRYGSKNTKTRLKLSREELRSLINDGGRVLLERKWEPAEIPAKNEILWHLLKSSIRPTIVVRYKRKALINDSKTIRMTFDSELETCKKEDFGYTELMIPVNKNKLVMEVKFSYLMPGWFDFVLRKYDLRADTYSKYQKSLEALHGYNPLLR